MSMSEPFNFGRKIKDLKRIYNKTYADLTSGLKISRERIVQLEENEREPTDLERRRFAEFYALSPEELGAFGTPQPNPTPSAPPRPPMPNTYTPNRPTSGYNQPSYGGGGYEPIPGNERRPMGGYEPIPGNERRPMGGGYEPIPGNERRPMGGGGYEPIPGNERRPMGGGGGNYEPMPGNERRPMGGGGGNYEPMPGNERRPAPGGYNNPRPNPGYNQPSYGGGNYEPMPGNYPPRQPGPGGGGYNNPRQPGPGGGGYNNPRQPGPGGGGYNNPRQPGPGGGGYNNPRPQSGGFSPRPPVDEQPKPARPPKPKEPREPRPAADKSGEPKPVMKYTAEQLGDIESAYLRKQRDLKVPLKFTFLNGKEYTGVVQDFTPFTVHILDQETGEELILRKLAMAYYRKADAMEEMQREHSEDGSDDHSQES